MDEYYCPGCANALNERPPVPTDPLGTTQQKDWLDKHTSADSCSYRVQSVLDCANRDYVTRVIQEAVQYGAIHKSYRGTNAIHCPSTESTFGTKYNWDDMIEERADTAVVVKTSDPMKVHLSKLEPSSNYSGIRCDNCAGPFLG